MLDLPAEYYINTVGKTLMISRDRDFYSLLKVFKKVSREALVN